MREEYRESAEVIRQAWPDWEIRDTIGAGSFAVVYRASRKERIEGEKDSAIKIIRIPHDDTDWDRMIAEGKTPEQARDFFRGVVDDSLKEIRAMEELSGHTNIVNIFDYKLYQVPERNVWYILIRMELLQKVDTGSMDEREIIRLGTDVCTALSICRKKNVVHRDVSLDNIFIHDGNYKLGDFGVAKILEGSMGGMQSMAGKPLYMAPEIYNASLAETDIDSAARVDIYSLGILLYRLAHHMNYPFEDPDVPNVSASERSSAFRRRVIECEELPPPKYASPALAGIILKASMANPARRYGSADEMRDGLQALATARETGMQEKQGSRFSGKALRRIAAAVLALVLIAAGVWLLARPRNTAPAPDKNAEAVGLESDMIRVILTAPETMNVPTFDTTVKMLKERLDIFTDGFDDYEIDVKADRIDLMLPRAAFPKQKYDLVLAGFLVRPTRLYAYDAAGENGETDYIRIERSDLERVEIRKGPLDGVNPADYDFGEDDFQYIEVVLTDDFVSRVGSQIGAWKQFTFLMDYEQYRNTSRKPYSFDTVPSGDGKTFCILVNDPDGRSLRIIRNNLSCSPMPDALEYEIDLNYITAWQTRGNARAWGQNQCEFPDLEGETATFRFSALKMREGEELDLLNTLKKRLDSIGTPYALGISADDTQAYYTVAMAADRTGPAVMNLIIDNYIYLKTGLSYQMIKMENILLRPGSEPYKFTLALNPESSSYEKADRTLHELVGEAGQGDGTIFLYYGYTLPLFAARAEDFREDGALEFTCLCEVEDSALAVRLLTESDTWLVNFMQALIQNPYPIELLYYDKYQINTGFGVPPSSVQDFGVRFNSRGNAGLREEMQGVWKDAAVTSNLYAVHIRLDLPLDEFFAGKAVSLVQKMYGLIDFSSMPASSLYFDLDSRTNPNPVSIVFRKKQKNMDDQEGDYGYTDTGYIYVNILSPRTPNERHCEELMNAVNGSEFFKPYLRDESGWYQSW